MLPYSLSFNNQTTERHIWFSKVQIMEAHIIPDYDITLSLLWIDVNIK